MKKNHLSLVLCATALVIIAVTGCTGGARRNYYLEQADRLFKACDYDKAELQYLNVLRIDPQNSEAFGRLGLIYYDEGRFQKAAPYLYKGSQLNTNNLDLRLKLAQIYLAVGMLKEAHNQAQFVLDQNPGNPEAPVLFAQSAIKKNDIAETRKELQARARSHDTAPLETGLGILAAHEHDFRNALLAFQRALALDAHCADAYGALGNTFAEQGQFKQAESSFKAAADCAEPRSLLQLEYGHFEIQSAHFASARSLFNGLATNAPDYVPAWLGLAEVSLDEKKLDDCATALRKALNLDPGNVDARLLNARLDLASTNTAKAVGELEQLARQYPQAPRIHYQLGLAYIVSGQPDKSLNQLHEAADLDPNFVQAAFLLAQLELKSGDWESALNRLKQLVAQQPGFIQAKLLLADAYRAKGNLTTALDIYKELEISNPTNAEIPLLAGTAFVQQLNEKAARREFNRALQINPGNVSAGEELAQLDLADHQFPTAENHVKQIISHVPDQVFPRVLLAKIYLAEGETNESEVTLQKAIGLPGADQVNFLLAQLYYDSRQDQRAMDVLNAALAKNPKDIPALMLLAVVQNDQKDYRAAANTYTKLLAVDPRYSPALNNLAWLYCNNLGDLDKAYDLAQRARQLLPTDPATADTLGWILFKKQQYNSALKLFQESANNLPDNPEVQFHLGLAHYMLADEDSAREAFQRALDLNKDFPELHPCQICLNILNIDPKSADATAANTLEKRIAEDPGDPIAFSRLISIYNRDNNSSNAISLCETVLKANPNNFNADLMLAQLCAPTDPGRAFTLAKAAYELNPDNIKVRAVLGRMAYLNGNDQWAFSLLEDVSREANDPHIFFDLANAAFCVGKISQAQNAMQSALQGGLSPSQTTDANNFLNLMAFCENPETSDNVQSHVDQMLNSDPNNAPARFAHALIAIQNADPVGAERDYESLLGRHPGCVLAEKNLAILYAENLVEPDKAYPVAVKAREAFPDDPQVAKALALILFQRGDYMRAADLFKTVSVSSSADAQLFYCLGISEYHLKNFVDSRSSLEHALNLNLTGQEATDARQTLAELKN